MIQEINPPTRHTIEANRIIGHIKGSVPGPTLIFTGGIHGNEPSGVVALQNVCKEIQKKELPVKGNLYAIGGNLWALQQGLRFHKEDLNRIWTSERMAQLKKGELSVDNEDIAQQIDIYKTIQDILKKEEGPFYFMDLHTTSSKTVPFLTVNDSLLNRKFAQHYPAPIILGIEEYLDGPLLSWINELGYVAFGYEAGQHDDEISIEKHIAFIYLSLVFAGCLDKKYVDFDKYYNALQNVSNEAHGVYEIFYRYKIKEQEEFKMKPGFLNFQEVKKGQELAVSNGKSIIATITANIFMPLYQDQGDDGFFAIRKIHPAFLKLSARLRKWRFDRILTFLPGVNWATPQRDKLLVNLKIARFFTKRLFHLLGYRSKFVNKSHLVAKNREAASRYKEYKNEEWFNRTFEF